MITPTNIGRLALLLIAAVLAVSLITGHTHGGWPLIALVVILVVSALAALAVKVKTSH